MSKKIIRLQIFFFILFLLTLFLPYINKTLTYIPFTALDIFVYIFSLKINIFLFILILLLIFQLFFGRIFCSFICPMGNLISFFDSSFKPLRKKKKKKNYKLLTFIPIIPLLLIFIFKIFNIDIISFINPLAIIHKFFISTFTPILDQIFRFKYNPPFYTSASYILLFIILLSFFGERIWCKFFCALGFIHRICSLPAQYVRIVPECTSCMKCSDTCPTNAINTEDPTQYDKTQCILCFKCVDECPGTTVFTFKKKSKGSERVK